MKTVNRGIEECITDINFEKTLTFSFQRDGRRLIYRWVTCITS